MHFIKSFIVLWVVLSLSCAVCAQNGTSSPSSRFGYGEKADELPTLFHSMGGVSAGMRTNRAINPSQPASYTVCDSTSFMFDVAAGLMWTRYEDAQGMRNKANANLEYVFMQFPIWKQHIALSAGVMPYSSMGYDFALSGKAGAHEYKVTYAGEGGIAQVYGGLSFNICDWVALGANLYYMFGTINNSTLLSFTESTLTASQMYKQLTVNSFRFRYGMQVFHTFAQKHAVVLGATFENKRKLNAHYLQYELSTVDSVFESDNNFQLPMFFSVGGSYTYNERLTVALDYSHYYTSNVRYFETGVLKDRSKMALGMEYRHNPMGRNYAERMYWRVGAALIDSYTRTTDKPDFTVSIGMGFPLRTTLSMVNIGLEYQRRNSMTNISENCLKMIVDITVNENWFFKRRL